MKILRDDDDENTWEPRKNLAHLVVFKNYIAKQKSAESSQKKNATPKKVIKNYAYKSPLALSSTRAAAKKAGEDEENEEDEDDGRNETAEMDETGKGIQISICLFTINEPNKLVLIEPTIANFVKNSRCRYKNRKKLLTSPVWL